MRPHYILPFVLVLGGSLAAQGWVQAAPSTSPPPTAYARMAYDTSRGVAVLFGGFDFPTGATVHQDTWEYTGGTWTRATPATRPPGRCEHMMTYDNSRAVTVMFGGQDQGLNQLSDLWEYDGSDWALKAAVVSPPARLDGSLAYDSTRNVSILFGGYDSASFADLDDTWEWDGSQWTQVTPAHAPPARAAHTMVFDDARGRIVLFGGRDALGNVLGDAWEYDGNDWMPVAGAPARSFHQSTYDSARGRTVVFGGGHDQVREYDGSEWRPIYTRASPPSNSAHAMAYDPARGVSISFGGIVGGVATNETWEYEGSGHAVYSTFGTSCGNLDLLPQGAPVAGQAFQIDISGVSFSNDHFVITGFNNTMWGSTPLPFSLGALGLSGCTLYTSVDAIDYLSFSSRWTVNIPNDPNLAGLTFFNQALEIDPIQPLPWRVRVSRAGEGQIH